MYFLTSAVTETPISVWLASVPLVTKRPLAPRVRQVPILCFFDPETPLHVSTNGTST